MSDTTKINEKSISMKKQLLRDPAIFPTEKIIETSLNDAYSAYHQFINQLEKSDIQLTWKYYTDGKAWLGKGLHSWYGVRGEKKVTTIFWCSIWEDFFKVTFYYPEKYRKEVLSLPLTSIAKEKVSNSKQMGKMKFFPLVFDVDSINMFNDIFTLVNFKKKIK